MKRVVQLFTLCAVSLVAGEAYSMNAGGAATAGDGKKVAAAQAPKSYWHLRFGKLADARIFQLKTHMNSVSFRDSEQKLFQLLTTGVAMASTFRKNILDKLGLKSCVTIIEEEQKALEAKLATLPKTNRAELNQIIALVKKSFDRVAQRCADYLFTIDTITPDSLRETADFLRGYDSCVPLAEYLQETHIAITDAEYAGLEISVHYPLLPSGN